MKGLPEIKTCIPFAVLPGMICLPFFLVGHLLRSYGRLKYIMDRLHPLVVVFVYFLSIVPIFLNSSVNIRTVKTGNVLLFYSNAVCLTLLLWVMSRKLDQSLGYKEQISTFISSIGKNSIVYLCMNQMIITGCEILAVLFHISIETTMYKGLCFIVVMTILGIISHVFTKTPLLILIGGKK